MSRQVPKLVRPLLAFTGLCAAVWLAVWAWATLPVSDRVDAEAEAEIACALRRALDEKAVTTPRLSSTAEPFAGPFVGPAVVTLYDRGAPVERAVAYGSTLGAAIREAARQVASWQIAAEVRSRGRLKVDLVVARAPVLSTIEPLFALSVLPGVDGIGLDFGGREALLVPDDLIAADLLTGHHPTEAMEFELGMNTHAVVQRLSALTGATAARWKRTAHHFFRFRTDSFVEAADRAHAPLPVWRGGVAGPEVTRETLEQAAVASGEYLLRHLLPDGRFEYEYYPHNDFAQAGGDYSLPRHAGATYYLGQLYGATHDRRFLDGAERAIGFLQREASSCATWAGTDRACIGKADDAVVDLGASAMTLVALSEYERVTGSATYHAWAARLANFLLFMQKKSGDFCHLYRNGARDEHTMLLYYSGEAAFALAKFTALSNTPSPEQVAALDRGLTFLTSTLYDHLAGQFFFGEDHWTCMAAEAGWEHLPPAHRLAYSRFCDDFVAFLRRTQFTEEEAVSAAQPDFVGAYGFSPLLPPHPTPVGSRSETTLSTLLMDRRRGIDIQKSATWAQVERGMRFLLAHQIRADGAYLMANPESARGGFLMSDVKRLVRIDFIQHAGSAMLRTADLYSSPASPNL